MHLFCFPFAGGNSYSYKAIEAALPVGIRLVPFELPGRGTRSRELPKNTLMELVEDAFANLKGRLQGPYAFFGHSMGASLAHELARRIVRAGLTPPLYLFVSGRQAPSVPEKRRRWDLPKEQFLDMLRRLGGCPPEILQSEEFMEFFEPILRADFEAVETHVSKPGSPLDVPIAVLIGDQDEVTREEAQQWQHETTREIAVSQFRGGHFFIFEHQREIADLITVNLMQAQEEGHGSRHQLRS